MAGYTSIESVPDTLRRIGASVRARLEEQGITVAAAARACGVPRSTFSDHLASGNFMVVKELYPIAGLLDTSVADLFDAAVAR